MIVTQIEDAGVGHTPRPRRETFQYVSRHIAGPRTDSVVPTPLLRDLLIPILAEIDAYHGMHSLNEDSKVNTAGSKDILAKRAKMFLLDNDVDSIIRRISSILSLSTRQINLDMADCLLLAGGTSLAETSLPVVPSGYEAARERILINWELRGFNMAKLTPALLEDQIQDLLEYSRLIIHGIEPWATLTIDWEAANKALHRHLKEEARELIAA